MPDYSKSKIYKIYSLNKPELVYIGSTTQKLSQRLAGHMGKYKMWKQGKSHHVSSFEVFDAGNHRIELIEEYPCENKEQLFTKEGQHIRELDCVNKRVAGRTDKQYARDNYTKIRNYKKKLYEENKGPVLNKCREYYEQNADKVKAIVKKYREENAEKVKAKKKIYYEKNKDKVKAHHSQVITCELCGKSLTRVHLRRHQRSSACIKE